MSVNTITNNLSDRSNCTYTQSEVIAALHVASGDVTSAAKRLGVSRQSLSAWIRRRPSMSNLRQRIALSYANDAAVLPCPTCNGNGSVSAREVRALAVVNESVRAEAIRLDDKHIVQEVTKETAEDLLRMRDERLRSEVEVAKALEGENGRDGSGRYVKGRVHVPARMPKIVIPDGLT